MIAIKKQYILIVDDKKENLFALERVLAPLEHIEVIKALSGNDALAANLKYEFALIILDVQMPEMDGYEVAEILKFDKKTQNVPIIFLSAVMTDEFHIGKAYDTGAIDFVTKPYNPELLMAKVKVFLELDRYTKHLEDVVEERTAALAEASKWWQQTFDSIDDYISIVDMDHRVVAANKAMIQTFGGSVVGNLIHDLLNGSGYALDDGLFCDMCTTSAPVKREIERSSRGQILEVSMFPIFGDDGDMSHYVHVVRDVTEMKLLEDKLNHSEKMQAMGQLAGGIAHDFNNQLAAILGFADILKSQLSDDGGLKRYADRIETAAKNSSALTKKLLLFSRRGVSKKEIIDIHDILRDTFELALHSIDKRISIESHLNANNCRILGDNSQISNCFLNLIINAADSINGQGTITVATSQATAETLKSFDQTKVSGDGNYLLITVSDTGSGMSRETLARMFEPFFTTKEAHKGTGLGLSAVYGTVMSHAGTTDVKSELGKGTTFSLAFPLIEETAVEQEDKSGNAPMDVPDDGTGKTILLIDDEEPVRSFVEGILTDRNYTVISCENGLEGVDAFKTNWQEIDLVLLDMRMPVMDGGEAFAELIKIDSGVTVILCSGYTGLDADDPLLSHPNISVLAKPFDVKTLTAAIKGRLSSKREG